MLLISEKQAEEILSVPYIYSPENAEYLPSKLKKIQLQDTTYFWEVIAQHTQSSNGLTAANETLSAGVCVFDANNDGWMDLLVVGGSGFSRHYGRKSWWNNIGGNRLLINDNGQRFIDKTAESGLEQRQWASSCAIADLDLDGLQDIIITGYGQNRLFKQTDSMKFVDVTLSSGVLSDNWSTGAALGDFNNDGLVDIYISNFVQFEKGKRTFEQDSGFKSSITENFSPALYDPEPNRLYLNLGNMQFESVEKQRKVDNAFGRSLFAKWHDFNGDNWLDLLVINDFNSPNQIYLNQSGKQFVPAQDGFSAFHLSGSRDLAIVQENANQPSNNPAYFFSRSAGQSNVFLRRATSESVEYTDQARSANLASNLHMSTDNWGVIAFDINNDGYQDIYQTSGSLIPDQESKFVTQRQSNSLYLNSPSGFSINSVPESGYQPIFSSRGAVSADLNNDGQLELIVANNNGPLQILSSNSIASGSWIGIRMDNAGQDYSSQQAKIRVRGENTDIEYMLDYKQSLFSQSDPRMHLGLGNLKSSVDIEIRWPDGQVAEFSNVVLNSYYRVDKSSGQISKTVFTPNATNNRLIELVNNASQQDIHHLMKIAFYSKDKTVLNALWNKANATHKTSLMTLIASDTKLHNQAWLFSALQDSDVQVVLAALAIFKQKEWDHSVIYLLPLFEHDNQQVVCEIADMFRFFFEEEEAVPERKGLAVAPIMRALSSANDEESICLLNALAASENKRAVLSVIDTLNKSSNPRVQSNAIKTLGLIRDARAINEIKNTLLDTDSAEVTSAALIALKRLNDKDLSDTFTKILAATPNEGRLIRQLDTIRLLLTDSDGVVISRSLTINALTKLTDFIEQFDGTALLSNALLKTIGSTKDKRFQKLPEAYLADNNARNQAALTLFRIGDNSGQQKANNVLSRLSDQDLKIFLARLHEQQVPLPLNTIKELAIRCSKSRLLSHDILAISNNMGFENYQRWIAELLKISEDTQVLVSAINAAIRSNVNGQIALQKNQWANKPEVISKYLEWQYIQSSNYPENERVKLRLLLNRMLRDNQVSIDIRQSLLLVAAEQDPFVADNFLFNNGIGLTEKQIAKVLANLPSSQTTKEQIALFERILDNQDLPIQERLVAASGLLSNNPDRKQEILAKL